MTPRALTIAGFDPSGGAGLGADLKVFHQHGVDGAAVATMVTAQNRSGVSRVAALHGDLVAEQLASVLADGAVAAVKCGALGTAAVVEVVAAEAAKCSWPLVIDPVLRSTSGAVLLDGPGVQALTQLLAHAALVTPNLAEAALLAGRPVRDLSGAREAAAAIADLGPSAVLVTGGHLPSAPIDVLWIDGGVHELPAERIETPHTHGTGCALSAAITARLARGEDVGSAVRGARAWLLGALARSIDTGRGSPDYHHPV